MGLQIICASGEYGDRANLLEVGVKLLRFDCCLGEVTR
jgi:hypothetical protein